MLSKTMPAKAGRSEFGARVDRAASRCLDVVGASFGLVVLSPVFIVIALLVRCSSPGPALYRSTRVGRYARPFTLYKFRSMSHERRESGPSITSAHDARVTSLGKMLRRFKLDELPQLFNVLVGDMSLVGPRPEAPEYVARYSREQLTVLDARPGMTSPASLAFRNEEALLSGADWHDRYLGEIMPAKLAIDADYVRRRSVFSDVGVIFETVRLLLKHDRAA